MAEETALPPPIVLALVLAENGQYDNATGAYNLLNTLPGIQALTFPCFLPSFCIYAALTNGRSEVLLTIRLVDADEQRTPIVEVRIPLLFSSPTQMREVMFTFPGLHFPQAGTYRAQVFVAGQLLAERQLEVFQAGPSNE